MLTLADVAAVDHGRVARCKGVVMDYQIVFSPEFNINYLPHHTSTSLLDFTPLTLSEITYLLY
jgi:hypothetical protein